MKYMPKFLIPAAMVAAMATSFSAVQAATPPDTLVQAWQIDDITSLDPAEIFEFSDSEIAGNTYERLINYDPKDVSKIYGEVAESWTVSPDGKTFTFKIRPNKKFASGNPLSAEDVVFSLQRAVAARQVAGLHHRSVRPDEGQREGQDQADRPARVHHGDSTRPMRRPSFSTA